MSTGLTDELAFALARATMAAAAGAARHVGCGDERAADEAAEKAMHAALGAVFMNGRIVIGEAEREAGVLFVGEKIGAGKGVEIDLAVDPLEGTTLAAKAKPNAVSVLAACARGKMMRAPELYMEKIAIGPGYANGVVDLDKGADANVRALAEAKGVATADIGVCVLDRPRHAGIIEALRSVGARVHLIGDGDIVAAINCAKPETCIDMYVGQGGATEGVLAAAALKCMGGQFQGRFIVRNEEDRIRAERAGIEDARRKFDLHEFVSGDVIFIATGVTTGSLAEGARVRGELVRTHSLVLNSATKLCGDVRMQRSAR